MTQKGQLTVAPVTSMASHTLRADLGAADYFTLGNKSAQVCFRQYKKNNVAT